MRKKVITCVAIALMLSVLTVWSFRTTRVPYSRGTYEIHRLLGRIVRIDSVDRNGIHDSSVVYSWKHPYRPIGCGPEPLLFCEQTIHDANLDGKWDTWFSAAGRTGTAVLVRCELDTNKDGNPDITLFSANTNFAALNSEAKKRRGFGIWPD